MVAIFQPECYTWDVALVFVLNNAFLSFSSKCTLVVGELTSIGVLVLVMQMFAHKFTCQSLGGKTHSEFGI